MPTTTRTSNVNVDTSGELKAEAGSDPSSPPGSRQRDGGVEHRAHARSKIEVEVTLETDSNFFAGITLDISRGGVFVATYRLLPVGSHVEIKLELTDGPLEISGTVRWIRDQSESTSPGMGIAFDSLTPEASERLEAFGRARAPLYVDVDDD